MGVSIGLKVEICETTGLPIPIVPRLHERNGYIKRKLGVSRAQKSNGLFGLVTVLSSEDPQTTPFHGDKYRVKNGNMRNSGLPILLVPHFHQRNDYIKRKLGVW